MVYIAQSYVALNAKAALLTWDPVIDLNLEGYNIYIRTPGNTDQKILVKNPWYTTEQLEPGEYIYTITTLDISGNESQKSSEVKLIIK